MRREGDKGLSQQRTPDEGSEGMTSEQIRTVISEVMGGGSVDEQLLNILCEMLAKRQTASDLENGGPFGGGYFQIEWATNREKWAAMRARFTPKKWGSRYDLMVTTGDFQTEKEWGDLQQIASQIQQGIGISTVAVPRGHDLTVPSKPRSVFSAIKRRLRR